MGRRVRHASSDCYSCIVSPGQSLISFWAQLCTYSQGDGKALMVPWLAWPTSKTLFLRKRETGPKVYTIQHFLQELGIKCPNMISFKNQRKLKTSLRCALSSFFKVRGAHTSWDSLGAVLTSLEDPSWSFQHFLITQSRVSTRSKLTVGLLT